MVRKNENDCATTKKRRKKNENLKNAKRAFEWAFLIGLCMYLTNGRELFSFMDAETVFFSFLCGVTEKAKKDDEKLPPSAPPERTPLGRGELSGSLLAPLVGG